MKLLKHTCRGASLALGGRACFCSTALGGRAAAASRALSPSFPVFTGRLWLHQVEGQLRSRGGDTCQDGGGPPWRGSHQRCEAGQGVCDRHSHIRPPAWETHPLGWKQRPFLTARAARRAQESGAGLGWEGSLGTSGVSEGKAEVCVKTLAPGESCRPGHKGWRCVARTEAGSGWRGVTAAQRRERSARGVRAVPPGWSLISIRVWLDTGTCSHPGTRPAALAGAWPSLALREQPVDELLQGLDGWTRAWEKDARPPGRRGGSVRGAEARPGDADGTWGLQTERSPLGQRVLTSKLQLMEGGDGARAATRDRGGGRERPPPGGGDVTLDSTEGR